MIATVIRIVNLWNALFSGYGDWVNIGVAFPDLVVFQHFVDIAHMTLSSPSDELATEWLTHVDDAETSALFYSPLVIALLAHQATDIVVIQKCIKVS